MNATWTTRLVKEEDVAPHFLRVAVKDNIDMAGEITTNGSRVAAARATSDAACLSGIRAAESAVVVGKTNLHELAFGVTGINPWFGTPVNPLDPALVPGGSSSGSAVAVAVGEADVALGSDTGGSIRMPAACCGVAGLKTTWGRVSLEGVRPLAPSLDTVGPMASDVAGLVTGMTLLEPGFRPSASLPARVGRLRLPAERWIDAAIDAALAGFDVTDVTLEGWDAATAAAMVVLGAEAWEVHGELWRTSAAELSPDVAVRLEKVSHLSREEVDTARRAALAWRDQLSAVFDRFDVLALPVLAEEPPTIERAARLTEIRYVAPFNLAGVPVLALPVAGCGRVPASLQLVGPVGAEELLVATGAEVERTVANAR